MSIHYFTDGASRGNPGYGACGFVQAESGYYEVDTNENVTNNRMELQAVINCLEFEEMGDREDDIVIHSDSNLVVGYFMKGWKANQNLDQHKKIKEFISNFKSKNRNVTFIKVKGHTGKQDGNNAIDTLLNRAMDKGGISETSGYFSDYKISVGVQAVVNA